MKNAIKNIFKNVTKTGNFEVVFEAREIGYNVWIFIIIYDPVSKLFIAGWNKENEFDETNLKYFKSFRQARKYILGVLTY